MNQWRPQTDWQRLFPADDYRFRMGLRKASARDFFAPSPDAPRILRERRHWLAATPDRYAALLVAGIPVLDEFAAWLELCPGEQPVAQPSPRHHEAPVLARAQSRLADLATRWEPDFVLLIPSTGGPMRVVGGAVCFPSSWALVEKMGHTLAEVHAPVPTLNAMLGLKIDAALSRLTEGQGWVRENWGLAPDAELNRHPARGLASLGVGATLETTWVRLEHQVLLRLPVSGGVVFGIRVTIHPLAEVVRDPTIQIAVTRALTSMPPEVAEYKGVATARAGLAAQLGSEACR
jgi:hypothetical protein